MTSARRTVSPEKKAYLKRMKVFQRDLVTLRPLYRVESFNYTLPPCETENAPLALDLYRPQTGKNWPVVIWLHAGGFLAGSRQAKIHAVIAGHFVRRGYAVVIPDYRLHRQKPLISAPMRRFLPALLAEAARNQDPMKRLFQSDRALAVLEDCAALLCWLKIKGPAHGLGAQITWGGSSAGAIAALNALYLLPALEMTPFTVRSAIISSGGFAYGRYARPGRAPVLALHGPEDKRVPIGSIRGLKAQLGDAVTLIESDDLLHGELGLTPDEPLGTAIDRLVEFDCEAAKRLA